MRTGCLILAALLVGPGCRTPVRTAPPPLTTADRPNVPPVLSAADGAFRDHLRRTQLSAIPVEQQKHEDVLRSMLRWKTNQSRAQVEAFEAALTRDADVDVVEFALLRLAQLHLNLACEISSLGTPVQMTAEQREMFHDTLDASALKVLDGAQHNLDEAAALGGRRFATIVRLRKALPRTEADVASACQQTRDAWTVDPVATLDEVVSAACADGEAPMCWVWGVAGTGGRPALDQACSSDVAQACLALADRRVALGQVQSDPGEAGSAERLYHRACSLGSDDGCRRELAVVVPAHRVVYQRACLDEEDAIACLKLARVVALGEEHGLWWSCTGERVPVPPDERRTRCENGSAFACASRATELAHGAEKRQDRYRVEVTSAGASGTEEAVIACGEDVEQSCERAAGAFLSDPASVDGPTCATVMLLTACARGQTGACGFPKLR